MGNDTTATIKFYLINFILLNKFMFLRKFWHGISIRKI
ncbi:hypothetical protein CAMGR0001_0951 [Campylobacter gracilis RM3268]|uniref:Uncharacterized protein n=1 Tax=Campylobacter gracilis RM3268 TaxID=553220 RepID=C8PGF8_9BACT|nr:hypothetical protein CAMGR0001_0951 [Campylobacter gracilis RM3268]